MKCTDFAVQKTLTGGSRYDLKVTHEEFLNALKEQRLRFHENLEVDAEIVGEDVLRSWERCKKMNVSTLYHPRKATREEYEKAADKDRELLECSVPLIEKIFMSIKNSGSIIGLANAEGLVLYSINDSNANFSKLFESEVGIYASEEHTGTNAYGTCITERRTVEIIGAQHYALDSSEWYCTASPVFASRDKLIGVINICTNVNNLQLHTYGMVEALAKAVSEQIQLKQTLMLNETMINSIDSGVLILDDNGTILNCNRAFRTLFPKEGGQSADEVFKKNPLIDQILRFQKEYDEEETAFSHGKHAFQCLLTSRRVSPDKHLILIRRMERLRHYTNRIMGSTAIYTFQNILGESAAMREVCRLAATAAESDMTVLIRGESGTGKELFAHAIHKASPRKNGPFIVVNCGALPRTLVESELFGYEGGSFTGASRQGKPGKFELADGGTIFLDEIGDMPLDAQTSLLRLLQEKAFTRIGGIASRRVDVRVIAATHRNLEDMVEEGSFRQDLYYRLNVMGLRIPALRERREDIRLLAEHYLRDFSEKRRISGLSFAPEAISGMEQYGWPGNVRELENRVEVAVSTSPSSRISLASLNLPRSAEKRALTPPPSGEREGMLGMAEKDAITAVLAKTGNNIKAAAKVLGCSRSTLYRKMEKYGIA